MKCQKNITLLLNILLLVLFISACDNYEEINSRLNIIESEISDKTEGSPATSIIMLSEPKIMLGPNGEATLLFRINPSDAKLNLDPESPACQISLDIIADSSRSSLLVRNSEEFKIKEIKPSLFEDGTTIPGQYEATIMDIGEFIGYSYTVVLVIAGAGDSQISSLPFEISSTVFPELRITGLPIVMIDTPESAPVVSKSDWMKNANMRIYDKNGKLDYEGSLSIKGRGNSTWKYPKKPYALKLDSKSKILGMKKHKRWCLLANWMDRTLMRNAVAFEISRKTDLDYTPSGEFVELILNGKHCGNYYLTEQIKVDENRVNISELDPNASSGEEITGGYLFEIDKNFDETYKFHSEIKNFPWMFKDPDEVNDTQFEYVKNYVNDMEKSLYRDEEFRQRKFEDFMNLESFVDWWFVYELSINSEPYHPKSCYMHKDVGGKMTAGPVWDFDWGTFDPSLSSRFLIRTYLYYDRLFVDKKFVELVKERWKLLKPRFETIPQYIDGLKQQLGKSDEINSAMWPITQNVNGDENMSFSDAVDRIKSAYTAKLSWLDSNIKAM